MILFYCNLFSGISLNKRGNYFMDLIIRLLVTAVVYAGLLFLLSKAFTDFKIDKNAILGVTIILVIVDALFYQLLMWVAIVPKILTLWLLAIPINWAINTFIIWMTDKFSKSLEIGKFSTLLISGLMLALARWVVEKLT